MGEGTPPMASERQGFSEDRSLSRSSRCDSSSPLPPAAVGCLPRLPAHPPGCPRGSLPGAGGTPFYDRPSLLYGFPLRPGTPAGASVCKGNVLLQMPPSTSRLCL